ncbi:MAG TPA: serine/threonine-protein kinase [Gemmatimonadaceae bacterium]|nr:serine/threonine-protein kinase [Gemmatimonadaceae bacterium]
MSTVKICPQCGAEFSPEQRFCPNDGSALRPRASDDPLIGQVVADRYQILELLGEGGMGRVYLAEHVRMGRKSAVKVMSPNLALSADAVSRFNREAANASRINHPNVAQIYDFGETPDGVLYLAMEFVEGETLRAMIERDGPIPPPRAGALAQQIAGALAAAHHLGIVHRDLKPDNIMVGRHHDGSDWVKVVDFGIAKTVQGSGEGGSQTVTTAGVSLGTPEYMSPEQLAGERLDNRTDLYSLGLVLFNMLTADLPYPRVTSKETLVRRLTSRPRTLADVAPDVDWPPELQAALDRALAPEPVERYASAIDFGRDVVAATSAAEAETARVPASRLSGPTQRVGSPPRVPTRKLPDDAAPRRRAMQVAAGILVLGALGAGAVVGLRSRATPKPATPDTATPAPTPTTVAPTVTPEVTQAASAPMPPATPDTAAAVPPPAATHRASFTGHNWIRANGDSGAARVLPPNATDADRIRYMVDEIRGHLARAAQQLRAGEVGGVRGEFREAGTDVQMLRVLYPAAADSLRVEQQVRGAAIRLVQRLCPTVVADSTRHFPPNFTCENLLPMLGRGRQRAGAFQRRPYR